MSFILTERISIEKAIYMHEMPFNEFKLHCLSCENDEERKRIFNRVKKVCKETILHNGSVVREYKHSASMEYFGRLYSNGMQGCIKGIRGFLLCNTTDIDMKNAHPVILRYICKKYKLECPSIDYYISNREEVLESFHNKSRDDSKKYLLSCINRDVHNKNETHKFYRKWDNETKKIQTYLTEHPDFKIMCDTVPENREYNIKGSKMSRILGTYEDRILTILIETLQNEGHEVATLMMDGCMIYNNHYNNTDLLVKITNAVETAFQGLNMEWTYKPHNTDIVIPDGWKCKKFEKLVQPVVVYEPKPVLVGVMEGDDSYASKIILEKYPYWKCCNGTLYVYDDTTGMWSDKLDIQNNIISRFGEHLNILKTTKDGVEYTGKNYAKNNQKRKDIFPYIRENCIDNDWERKSGNSSLGKILFTNGHYDFLRSVFVAGRPFNNTEEGTENGFNPDIVFMYRIDHDFTHFTPEDMAYMETIKERLFTIPLGIDVGDYLILNLARGFAGDLMKRILFGLGMSNTGKGVLTKACLSSLGQYFGTFSGENLRFNNSTNDDASKMRWAFILRHKRLIISNEIKHDKALDTNIIKKLCSGGDVQQGRGLFGNDTDFVPHSLSIVLANDMAELKPFDSAMDTRVRVYSMTKCFVDEPTNEYELKKDPNLEKEMETLLFRRCFVGLLIQSYLKFQENGRIEFEPNEVKMARDDWVGTVEENDIMTKLQNVYEITNNRNNFIPSKDLQVWVEKTGDSSYKKFVIDLKKFCNIKKYGNVYNDAKNINGKNAKVWFGIRLIPDDIVDFNITDEFIEE